MLVPVEFDGFSRESWGHSRELGVSLSGSQRPQSSGVGNSLILGIGHGRSHPWQFLIHRLWAYGSSLAIQ